jgi:UDP-N-acetylglucosamine 1-carboxyvinyltransferase
MPKFIIQGQQALAGDFKVGGAKNNAQIILPACLLSKESMTIDNLPLIDGVEKSLELLEYLGVKIKRDGNTVELNAAQINTTTLDAKLADKFRTSVMFVGPLLARFGEVKFPHPGGCVIGASGRPIDLFLEGFTKMGAEVVMEEKFYHIKAKKLQACDYFFSLMTVTGTQSLMMTACLAEGTSILRNCAMEPEIEALADYLNTQGAKISGAGTPTIIIEGVKEIKGGHCRIIPDRLEAGSIALLAAAAQAEINISDCEPKHLLSLLNTFDKIGVNYEVGQTNLLIKKSNGIKAKDIKTHEYPGFPTDLQSPYVVLMTQAHGTSLIQESIYDRRLIWTDMLSQMGANITTCDPHRIVIQGPSTLYGKRLISPDIRAGIALVIAGLIAQGQTEIDNIYQLDRGYERLEERLRALGANIERVE